MSVCRGRMSWCGRSEPGGASAEEHRRSGCGGHKHACVCDGRRWDPWRKALRSTVVGGRGLTTSMSTSVSMSLILFIICAGRMLWRGSGNGTRMRVCVARVVVLL